MERGPLIQDSPVLLVALAQPAGRAIMQAMAEAKIAALLCPAEDLSNEVHTGVGAIVLPEEELSAPRLAKLAALIEEQPVWSDIPLIILGHTRGKAANTGLRQSATWIRNATFVKRPMRIATLLQAVKDALRARERQYRLRDQLGERDQLRALAERNERRLSAVLNNTRMAVFFVDERQHCTFMNAAAEKLTGFSLVETRGRSLHETLHHSYPDGRPYPLHECPIDRAFPENHQTEGEEVFIHKDGHFYPVAFTASPIRHENVIVGTVIEVRDITKRKAETARLHVMMDELNHRVKNTLVTVQSIVAQTMQGENISVQARDRVMSRVMALSRSHDLLTEKSWVSAPLREVVSRALAPFGAADDAASKFSISGDAFELHSKPALVIAMGLHELATNAVKYGALSVKGGRVDLSWKLIAGGILQLRWVERGGPSVKGGSRSGFGRRLIERGLAHELQGETRLSFPHDGVICEIDIPTVTALVARIEGQSNGEAEFAEGP